MSADIDIDFADREHILKLIQKVVKFMACEFQAARLFVKSLLFLGKFHLWVSLDPT